MCAKTGTGPLLVSQDTLLPEVGGLPAAAPGGVLQTSNPASRATDPELDHASYVFASPDGSQAFFQSEERSDEAALQKPRRERTEDV